MNIRSKVHISPIFDRNQQFLQSVKQTANFLAIMLDEERVKSIIQEHIDKFIEGCKPVDK